MHVIKRCTLASASSRLFATLAFQNMGLLYIFTFVFIENQQEYKISRQLVTNELTNT